MGKIAGIIHQTQKGHDIYNFSLTGEEMLKFCKIEHFGEHSEGVNRQYDERHALRIAEAMLDPDVLFLEPIMGDLRGPWVYRNGDLVYQDGAFISVDDGQHRLGALEALNVEEQQARTFTVLVTQGLPYELRLKLFMQQQKRKKIDARLHLSQRARTGEWKTDREHEAWNICLMLNSDPGSPLYGGILMEEVIKRPYEHQHRPVGVNVTGLMVTVQRIIGQNSPLATLSAERRAQVVLDMIKLARDIWPRYWESDQSILSTARGINALLMLMTNSAEFAREVGEDFSQESLRRGLSLASTYKWTRGNHKNASVKQIVERLDQSMSRRRAALRA